MPIVLKAVIAVNALMAPISYSYELDLPGPSRGAMGPGLHAYDFLVGLPLPAAPAHALPAHGLAGSGAPGERARAPRKYEGTHRNYEGSPRKR